MLHSRRAFLRIALAGSAALALPSRSWARRAATRSAGWRSVPSLPWPTQEVYGTAWNGQIVVAGGLRSEVNSKSRFTTLSGTAFFDPSDGAWSTGPNLPAPRHHLVLAAGPNRVYGFGGFVGETLQEGFQFRDDVYAFDGDEWARIGALPTPVGETVALSVDDRIHLVTGSLHPEDGDAQGASTAHLVYDPVDDTWMDAKPVPTARSSATGGGVDGRLYVAAGRRPDDGITNLGALERYDPETDTWTELRPVPQPSGGLNGAGANGRLYVFGGEYFEGGGGVHEHTWVYDPVTDRWSEGPPMPTPRHGLAGVAVDERIYAIGGNTAAGIGAATVPTVEALDPSLD